MPTSRCEPPVPPKVRIPQEGPLPFLYVLTEFEALGLQGEGLRLWQALRRVRDWSADSPDGSSPRPGGGGTGYHDVDPALRSSLGGLDRLLREPDPDAATLEAVAFACFYVATWAEERGAYRTALGFLHAAEDTFPENPHYAYNVGRVARKTALYADAEAWLKWAHYVARTHRRWDVATLALSGLGNLHRQRGNLPQARRLHEAARRMAKLKDLRTLEGDALYDLAGMAFDFGDASLGVTYTREALRAYGPGHGRILSLAHDVAWVWLDSFGKFESAVQVFTVLLDYIWDPPMRVLLLANLTRAAAGAGLYSTFEGMWVETWTLLRQQVGRQGHAAALVQLALGAGTLGQWPRAIFAAEEAHSVARERKEAEAVVAAESILSVLRTDVIWDEAILRVFKDRARAGHMQPDDEAADLTAQFAEALRARRDDAPQSVTRALISPVD